MVVNVLHLWKVEVKLLVENSDKWCCPAERASRSELPMTQFSDVSACFKKKKKNHIFSWNVHHISKWFSRNFNLLSCDSISHNLQKSCSKERKYFWTKTKKLHSNKFLPQMLTWLILLHKKTPQICYISAKSLHLVEYGQVKFTCIYFPSWLKINPCLYIFQLLFTLNYCFMLVEGEESFEISWKLR